MIEKSKICNNIPEPDATNQTKKENHMKQVDQEPDLADQILEDLEYGGIRKSETHQNKEAGENEEVPALKKSSSIEISNYKPLAVDTKKSQQDDIADQMIEDAY